jgi:hypothetical protein
MKVTFPTTDVGITGTFETGRQFDIGQMVNGHVKKSEPKIVSAKIVKEVDILELKPQFKDKRNSRCRECHAWITNVFKAGGERERSCDHKEFFSKEFKICKDKCNPHGGEQCKYVDCEGGELDEKKDQCKYVKFDLRYFVGRNREANYWFKTTVKTDLRTKELLSVLKEQEEIKNKHDEECKNGPEWCKNSLVCRSIGVSCFSPDMNGLGI